MNFFHMQRQENYTCTNNEYISIVTLILFFCADFIMFFTQHKKVYISMITYCCYLKQYKNNRNLMKSNWNLMTLVYNVGRERGGKNEKSRAESIQNIKGIYSEGCSRNAWSIDKPLCLHWARDAQSFYKACQSVLQSIWEWICEFDYWELRTCLKS